MIVSSAINCVTLYKLVHHPVNVNFENIFHYVCFNLYLHYFVLPSTFTLKLHRIRFNEKTHLPSTFETVSPDKKVPHNNYHSSLFLLYRCWIDSTDNSTQQIPFEMAKIGNQNDYGVRGCVRVRKKCGSAALQVPRVQSYK